MTSATPDVPHIRHQSGVMKLQIALNAVFCCILLFVTVILIIRSLRDFEPVLPFLIFFSVAFIAGLVNAVTIVETRTEGLFVGYLLRRDRIIPWSKIRKVTISFGRGYSCTVQHGTHFWQAIVFPVIYVTTGEKQAINTLVATIAKAAHLSRGIDSFSGLPKFEREQMN